jgi:hypothetical protein
MANKLLDAEHSDGNLDPSTKRLFNYIDSNSL